MTAKRRNLERPILPWSHKWIPTQSRPKICLGLIRQTIRKPQLFQLTATLKKECFQIDSDEDHTPEYGWSTVLWRASRNSGRQTAVWPGVLFPTHRLPEREKSKWDQPCPLSKSPRWQWVRGSFLAPTSVARMDYSLVMPHFWKTYYVLQLISTQTSMKSQRLNKDKKQNCTYSLSIQSGTLPSWHQRDW